MTKVDDLNMASEEPPCWKRVVRTDVSVIILLLATGGNSIVTPF